MHDFTIQNARIVDGTGAPSQVADLAVKDGRIAAIGRDLGPTRETIDGSGLVLAPGIIDGHTHYDAQITWDPMVDPSPALGVTTVVLGNCGFTIAPCRPEDRDITMRNLTQVEGMSLDALRNGIKWEFESFPQYLDMLEKRGLRRPFLRPHLRAARRRIPPRSDRRRDRRNGPHRAAGAGGRRRRFLLDHQRIAQR